VVKRQDPDWQVGIDRTFQDLRPDGRSGKALLKVEISSFKHGRIASPNPEPVRSEFFLKNVQKDNPAYVLKKKELEDCRQRQALPGKTPKPGQRAAAECDRIEKELDRIPIQTEVPEYKEYFYKRTKYTQPTELEISLRLIDTDGNQVIQQKTYAHKENPEGTGITGVHGDDKDKLKDQPPDMPDPEQAITAAQANVQQQIRRELPEFITPYVERFLRGGKQVMAGKSDEALEYLLCYWAFVHGRVGDHLSEADARLLQDFVRKETGYDIVKARDEYMALIRSGWKK
jgi:hypothetical protein